MLMPHLRCIEMVSTNHAGASCGIFSPVCAAGHLHLAGLQVQLYKG
jgi:hypothetical protein